jgi:hypothetical protein
VRARFFAHVQTGPEAHPASCTMGTGSFPGVKRPGRCADHPPPSSAEVEKEYSYTSTYPLVHFRSVTGQLYLYLLVLLIGNHDNVISIETRLPAGRLKHLGSIPSEIRIFI